jgi:hypothetical protein
MQSNREQAVTGGITRLLRGKSFWFFAILFSGAMLFVFSSVLSKWMAITSPDGSPFYALGYQAQQVEFVLAGKAAFTLHKLLLLFDPLTTHEFVYVLDQLLFALALAYYLRTQRVSSLAAYGGGLFVAFSGYNFTLFCAGHLGEFHNFAVVFWSLGVVNQCLSKRRLFYYAALGFLLMWGQVWQPDVWVLFVGLLAAYIVWRSVVMLRSGLPIKQLLTGILPRFILTLAVAGLVGMTGIRQVFNQQMVARDKQIEESSRGAVKKASVGQDKQNAFDRWIFATGWSLPPEDCAEFLVPGIFGNDSFRPPYPYWGRLGQPYAFQPGKMMPNYRQHTVYLGLVSVVVAFFGVLTWWKRRREEQIHPKPIPQDESADFTDVPFWVGAWGVCLALAMGRYTPVYKWFYAIPYMDYLRAPVKFLHFTEVATALLAGFGLESLLSGLVSVRLRRTFALGIVLLAGLLVLAALMFSSNDAAIEKHIAGLGLGQAAVALVGYSVDNCLRAAGIAVIVALLFWLASKRAARGTSLTVAVVCLMTLGVADLAMVAQRYVIPINVAPYYQANLVVKEMAARSGGRPANVANYVSGNAFGQDWFCTALGINGFANQLPDPNIPNSIERRLMIALKDDPVRFWRITGVRFVLLPRKQIDALIRQGILKAICDFQLGSGVVQQASPGADTLTLGEVEGVSLPAVYFNWQGEVPADRQIQTACESPLSQPVTDAPVSPATLEVKPQEITFERYRGQRHVLSTVGEVTLQAEGLLVFSERYSPDLEVLVDGKAVPVYQADGLWCATIVPQGRHQIECRMKRDGFWNVVALGTSLMVVLWWLAGLLAERSGHILKAGSYSQRV